MPSNSVSDLSIDLNGNLWIAAFDGGLTQLSNNEWTVYTSDNSALENDSIERVTIDADNNVWASTLDGGLTCLEGDPVENVETTTPKPLLR